MYKKDKSKKNIAKQNNILNQKSIFLKTYLSGVMLSFFLLPLFAYAATTYTQDIFGVFEYIKDIINDIVLWLFTTGAVLGFLTYLAYQVFKIFKGGKMDDTAKKRIMYGLIALTLMFTFYAVASLIAVTFGVNIGIPQFYKSQDGLSPGSGTVRNSRSILNY